MKIDKLPVLDARYAEMQRPGLREEYDNPTVYFDIASIMAGPYISRYFRYEDIPDLIGGAMAIMPTAWGMIGDMSVIGNFGDPVTIAACGRFARLVAYDEFADAVEETAEALAGIDPHHIHQYFTYESPPEAVNKVLSYQLVEKYHSLIDRSDYFDELFNRGSLLLQESDIYLPIESREALNREIADLIDVLPDYESRRWVPTIAGPNPIVFDLVVAAGERFFGEELLKRDQHVLKDLSVIAGLPIDPEARQIHRIETTSGHRFGVVENGQFRLVDAKSGATLAAIAYPA